MNKLTILGSGTSTGIPMLGCSCNVCQIHHPKDRRLRTSAYIQTPNGPSILIDTTPDLRAQLLAQKITRVDAAIITHDHADHLNGLDDLRPLCFNSCADSPNEIPFFTYPECAQRIQQRFDYAFVQKHKSLGGGVPKLSMNRVSLENKTSILAEEFKFFLNPHGHIPSLGFVHQSMAYIVDCQSIPQKRLEWLKSLELELLVIDCVRKEPHQTHLHLKRSLEYIEQIRPKKAGLIHMGHHLSHQELEQIGAQQKCATVFPCYDGQVLEYPRISG